MTSRSTYVRQACVSFLLLTTLSAAPLFAQEATVAHDHDGIVGCGKAQAARATNWAEQARTEWREEYESMLLEGTREAIDATDLLDCNLEIEIVPTQNVNIIGTNVMTIQSKINGLTTFTFRLRSQYTITSALINGVTPISVALSGTTTRIATLDRAYNIGETFTLTIAYNGHAESRGFGSIEFQTQSSVDIVSTLSEAYFAYTWWPCKDGDFGLPGDNGDKFTISLALITPSNLVGAANGLLQGTDTLSGSRKRYRWRTDYPVSTYLVFFSATNYNTYTYNYNKLAGGTMPVLLYLYPASDSTANRNAWAQSVQMITTLRDVYGEYPFVNEKYGIYQFPFGGGMEHQTFTGQGTFSESVTAHELGHQWWGDMVTCKTWNHIWLNEGFASYTEALWAEREPGSSGLAALKSTMASKKYTGSGTVYVSDAETADMNAIFDTNTTYNKAAWVVHMLRGVLGDDLFFDALAEYRSAFEGEAATTTDLQGSCEAVYGASLDWFFQEWVYGEYLPSYNWGWSSATVNGQPYLLLYVDQTQSASIQRFTMPLRVVANGNTYTIFNDADLEHFVVPVPATPTTVALDPDAWVLWSTRSNVTYVAGPPKIVQTSPLPGAEAPASSGVDTVTVSFHTPVNTSAAHYTLTGQNTGAVSVSYAYNSSNNTVTLTSASPLVADTYTLTVSASVTAVNSGAALDGEIADPEDPASLPSGNGLAGGAATIRFTLTGCSAADLDGDNNVGPQDLALLLASFGTGAGGDLDGDLDTDAQDLSLLLADWGIICP